MSFARVATITVAFAVVIAALPGAARADARDEVQAAYAALMKQGKFRSVGTADSPRGGAQKQSVEVVWPDRFHMMSPEAEIIVIPGATYMKRDGGWSQLPIPMGQLIDRFKPEAMKQAYDQTTNLKSLGDSTVNGHAVRGYEYDTTVTMMGVTAKSHNKLWVDKDTGLPARQESDGEAMGHKSHNVNDYEYDSAIKIEAPM
jgi:hypothetical protein